MKFIDLFAKLPSPENRKWPFSLRVAATFVYYSSLLQGEGKWTYLR